MGTVESLRFFAPELILLAAAILLVIVVDLVLRPRSGAARRGRRSSACVGALVAAIGLRCRSAPLAASGLLGDGAQAWLFGRMVVLDAFARLLQAAARPRRCSAAIWMSLGSREVRGRPNEGEYYALAARAAASACSSWRRRRTC